MKAPLPIEIINPAPGGRRFVRLNRAKQYVLEGRAVFEGERIRFLVDNPGEPNPLVAVEHLFSEEDRARAKRSEKPQDIPAHSPGVYILRSSAGLCKIGRSTCLYDRIASFWTTIPEDFEIFAFFPTSAHVYEENALHVQFKSKRVKGEWFALTLKDLAELTGSNRFLLINEYATEFLKKYSTR